MNHFTLRPAAFRSLAIVFMCFLYLVQYASGLEALKGWVCAAAMLVFLNSLLTARRVSRWLGLLMLLSGAGLMMANGAGWDGIVDGLYMNIPLLTLVILVPLIPIPFKMGGYFQTIHRRLERMGEQPGKRFAGISLFLFSLGPVLNLGSIRVLHDMLKGLRLDTRFLAKAYVVGYSSVLLWSPYFASVAMVLLYLDVPLSRYLPLAFTFAAIQWAAGNLMHGLSLRMRRPMEKRRPQHAAHSSSAVRPVEREEARHPSILKLFVIVVTLMSSIFAVEFVTGWSMLFVVSLVSLGFPLFWCLLFGGWRSLAGHLADFGRQSVPVMNNEVLLFLSAGLFGQSLAGTSFTDVVRPALSYLAGHTLLLVVVLIMAAVIVISFIGIHPIVTVTVLLAQKDDLCTLLTPETLALLLMIAWTIAAVAGPAIPLNLLISGLLKVSPISMGLRWNGLYLLSMAVTGSVYIFWLNGR